MRPILVVDGLAIVVVFLVLASASCRRTEQQDMQQRTTEQAACTRLLRASRTSTDSVLALATHPQDGRGYSCAMLMGARR